MNKINKSQLSNIQNTEVNPKKSLGNMTGDSLYTRSIEHDDKTTYSRAYQTSRTNILLRKALLREADDDGSDDYYNGTQFKKLGERYMQEGGRFLTLKELTKEESLNKSFVYALSTFGTDLELLAGMPMEEIQKQSQAYGIDYLLNKYFECVTEPQNGDLVVYQKKNGEKMHGGIYRSSEQNGNLSEEGSVESHWNFWYNPYVFQHDVFFLPDTYGDVAKFYRLKSESLPVENNFSHESEGMFSILDNGTLQFNPSEENKKIRKEITEIFDDELLKKFPQIQEVKFIKFNGLCYHYAFGQILKTYSMPSLKEHLEGNTKILEKYFTVTTEPQKGDLVVYYQCNLPVHYGIYCDKDIIESKWGCEIVYRHPVFYAPNNYGDQVKYLRLNPDLTPESLLEVLKRN